MTNDTVTKIAVLLFSLAWTLVLIGIGIPNVFFMLGGSTHLFILLPLFAMGTLKYREFSTLIWALTFCIACLVLINYLYSYFLEYPIILGPLVRIFVISLPVGYMLTGYLYAPSISLPIGEPNKFLARDEERLLRDFAGFLAGVLYPPITFIIPFLIELDSFCNINSLGYQIGLLALIISGVILLFEIRHISKETINYLSKPVKRFVTDLARVKKISLISTLAFIISSFILEFLYRKQWIMWAESNAALVILICVVFKFGQVLFMPCATEKPDRLWLPSYRSRRSAVILSIFLFSYLVVFFTVIAAYK